MTKLTDIYHAISGEEGYKELFSSLSNQSMKGIKFVASGSADKLKMAFDKGAKELIVAVGTNNAKINKAEKVLQEHQGAIFLTDKMIGNLTSSGDIRTLAKDIKTLRQAAGQVRDVALEAQGVNEKKLGLFSRYTKIKNTADATHILQSLDALHFPKPDFPHKHNDQLLSDRLPQGKVFEYNMNTHHFMISTQYVDEESGHGNAITVDEALALLSELKKIESVYKVLSKTNQSYSGYVKKFNTMIKGAFEYLDKGDIVLSPSIKRDLLSRLEGDKDIFALYTGFLPKVVNYIDEYIDQLTTHFISKS